MQKNIVTFRDAAEEWLNGFNAIPYAAVEKIYKHDIESIHEITPAIVGDKIYCYSRQKSGEIINIEENEDGEEFYTVKLEDEEAEENGDYPITTLEKDDFEVDRYTTLPMWGWLWTFGSLLDEEWAYSDRFNQNHLREMAECGFRIYEQDDFGILFGIDGCGYDFYESHWVPLYKARGLKWHNEEAEKCE